MKYVHGYMNEEMNFRGSMGGLGPPGRRPGRVGPQTGILGKTPQRWVGPLGLQTR